MPAYPWLAEKTVKAEGIPARMKALRTLGAPYSDEEIAKSAEDVKGKTELDAVIAYLQVLGTARSAAKLAPAAAAPAAAPEAAAPAAPAAEAQPAAPAADGKTQ
jgi:cytochrome c oxidase cbb3-type subunit 2